MFGSKVPVELQLMLEGDALWNSRVSYEDLH